MDLGAIVLLLALLIAVAYFLAAPLLRRSASLETTESPEVSTLLAERDRIITALQELDFDFKLGKVPELDYPGQRSDLLRQGAAVLKRLDEIAPRWSGGGNGRDAGDRIEQAAAGVQSALGLGDDQIESMLAARRSARRSTSAGFCPRCGRPILANDRFCPNCGKSLQ